MAFNLEDVNGIGKITANRLRSAGIKTVEMLANISLEKISSIKGFNESKARLLVKNAIKLIKRTNRKLNSSQLEALNENSSIPNGKYFNLTQENPRFMPKLIKEDDLYGKQGYILNLLRPNVYQFESKGAGCSVYLVVGENLNVLIDTGLITKFNSFNYLLNTEVGLSIEDIHLVVNTHEHFDHISSNSYFYCPTAAHRWAAAKIQQSDELITKGKKWGMDLTDLKVNIWLEDRNMIDLGNVILKVIETPGHTSGCICLYEPMKHYMFTGDTLFKGATSNIYESGSISEYIQSLKILNTLKISCFYPSHGSCVMGEENVKNEIESSIVNAEMELKAFVNRIKSKPIEEARAPPSLYDREEESL
ncbi:MAG: MBL fold metallo-hydrolase [Candidatus Lokiarchaeota archaeon]|nr:MBL fold metallo-hydrolase [Candidatus Lokiarchaeota archaeon]